MFYEGSIDAFAQTGAVKPDQIYTPQEINDRIFVFRNETVAAMSDAEIAYVRLDEQSTRYRYGSALRRCLAHLEAIATICVDGMKPDLRTMLLIEALELAAAYGHGRCASVGGMVSDGEHEAALAAIRYSDVLQDIALSPKPFTFNREMLIDLHKNLLYGADDSSQVRFRKRQYRVSFDPSRLDGTVYFPPEPERIPHLIDDLMEFCGSEKLTPVTQAAVAHFHLEAIRPFKTGMDRTGRAFVHCILRSRGLYRHIIPPIALVPAMDIPNHAHLLFPYRVMPAFTSQTAALALDKWVSHCARCVQLSVKSVHLFMKQISDIEDDWLARISDIRSGSAIDILLRELPGMPVITVGTAMALTGKRFSAANEAVNQLVNLGILHPMRSSQRNRCFEAPQVIDMLTAIEGKTIPTELVARESTFRQ